MTCTEADIIATTLLAWDDELSKELVELVNSKNTFIEERAKLKADELTSWKEFWEQRNWLRLKADSADMKIRQIVNYKILSWDYKAQAYQKLAKEMIESWENAWATIDLLRKIDATDIKEYDEIFRVAWWFDKENPVEFVNWVRDVVANSWATLYEQEDVAKELLVKKMQRQWASEEEITAAIRDLMWQDKDLISKWLTPHNFSRPDAEWTTIKNTVSAPEEQFRRWWQYCLGKAIIGRVDKKVLKEINKIVKAENTVWKLTAQQIDSTNTLEELMARAYTNTQDLVEDWLLRDSFSNRLSQLLANKQITDTELQFWEDLIRVSRFAEEWAAFSKIVLYKAVKDEAEKLWIKVGNPKKFTENIYKTIKDDDFLKKIDDKGMVTMSDGTKMAANDLLVLLTLSTWDKRIPKLLRSWEFSDSSVLWIATQVALGNSETATRKIIQLIGKVKEMPNLWDSKDLALMTLCWSKVQPWAKKGFFDYRSMYNTNDVIPETRLKADFEEKMANANRAEVAVDGLTDLTNEKDLATRLENEYAWGYIIVNDSWWRNNKEFAWALDAANSKLDPDKQITVLYPRQSQMSNFVFENGKLIFRSRDSRAFREIMDKVSLRTMWDADATRILRSLAYEMETWRNGDKIRYMVTKKYRPEEYANLAASSWEKDADGNILSNWQVKWWKDSYVRVDENLDKPMKLIFHWSDDFFTIFGNQWLGKAFWWEVIFTSDVKSVGSTYARLSDEYMDYNGVKDTLLRYFYQNIWWKWEAVYFRKLKMEDVPEVYKKMLETLNPGKKLRLIKEWSEYVIYATSKGDFDNTATNLFKDKDIEEYVPYEIYRGTVDTMRNYLINRLESWALNLVEKSGKWIVYSWYGKLTNPFIIDAWGRNWWLVMRMGLEPVGIKHWPEVFENLDDQTKSILKEAYNDFMETNPNRAKDTFIDFIIKWRYFTDISSIEDAYWKILRDFWPDNSNLASSELQYIVKHNFEQWEISYATDASLDYLPNDVDKSYKEFLSWLNDKAKGINYSLDAFYDERYWMLTTNWVVGYVKWLNEKWLGNYDWVIIKNVMDVWWYKDWVWHKIANDYILFNSNQFKSIDNKVPSAVKDINLERVIDWEWDDVAAEISLRVKLFKDDRTVEDIAKAYWVKVETVKKIVTEEWLEAYWCYWDWLIEIAEIAKESTWAHELFHAVFDIVDKKTKDNIIETSKKLFGYTDDEANEELAKAFSEWFRTWEFKYSNISKLSKKEQNGFFKKVKDFFNKIKKLWIDEVEIHKNEVEQMFNDMMDLKWQPKDWSMVSKAQAAWEYTKELEESANKYFAAMLWENDWANPNYRDTLHAKLEEMTWIPIKSLRDLNSVDKNKLWQAVNTQFTNAQRTTWKFKSEIIDITETIDNIESLTLEWVKEMLNNTLDWMVNNNEITEDKLPYIKQSLEELETASTIEEWLEAKGRLLALANGWNAERFTLDELVTIFTNGTYEQEYKQMFFPNQDLTEEELKKYVSWINNMIFDWLTVSLSSNLVKQWYALPLDSVREVVIDYLTWNLDTKSNFAKAFLYKNWLPDSNQVFKSVVQSAMPTDLKLGYEDAMYKLTDTKPSWKISRITIEDNPFLPDTYSSLASIVNAKTWVIQVNSEAKYLWNLLDKYEQVIKERLKNWISFEEAQQLKTQLWYALDIFEQDIVMAKYGKFLTPQQKSAIRNMKSYIAIVVGKEWEWTVWSQLTKLEEVNKNIMNSFTTWLEEVVDKYSALRTALAKWDEKAIAKLQEQMKANGTVMANVDWEIVVIDARENIKKNLQNLPESIKWFGWISTVDEITIDNLDGPSAYYLNSLIEAAKKLDALAKWEPAMMYHIDPELNMVRFFDTFKLVDYWVWEKIPAVLVGNILSWSKELSKFSLAWIDDKMKLEIFKSIKGTFQLEHTLSVDKLWEIINKAIERNDSLLRNSFDTTNVKEIEEYKQLVFNQYQQAFMPYTHLRDIPSGWAELWLKWVKEKINEILTNEIGKVREALDWMPGNYAEALNSVSITTPTWQSITLNEFLNWVSPNWKKAIFDDESIIVKSIDELNAKTPENNSPKEIARVEELNKEYSKKIVNQYNEVLQAIQNQQQVVSEAERHLASRMLNNARSIAQQYSLTNRLVETSNMVWGLEEEAARMMKYWLVWFKSDLTFWRYWSDKVLKRLKDTQDAYKVFYTKSLEEVNNIKPKNEAEELAKHLCKYFKTIEWHLGSVDWVTWVTTRPDINRAFYNIWEVFMNIDSVKWVFAFMSAVEENQFLKFFKFSNPNQASYVKEFTRPATLATEDIIWGYREYVTKMPDNINKDLFNEIFAANFTDTEFKSLYQALSWLTYVWWRWKTLNRFLWFVNGTTYIGRLLVSYPWQLFTIPQQWIAYFLKQKAQERRLWESDFSEIDRIRSKYWTLDKAYNEINLFRIASPDDTNLESYYNRYWVPDINDVYRNASLSTVDDVNDMYAKIANYQSTWDNTGKLMRSVDAYKDNANNIIDWLFARNFKNIAFLKAIRENAFMQFWSAQAFEEFMMNNAIDKQVKKQLMDAVNASAWRNFRNILWLGFWWLDRAVGWNAISNTAYWLMQMLNFRWAWWQNIFKQTWETLMTLAKMSKMWWTPEGREAIALYVARTPEFTNFVSTLANDLAWMWKLQRYQDNGRWNELEDEYDIMDFLEYTTEIFNMSSQWFQWILSFWPIRPVMEQIGSAWNSLRNPEIYKDTLWVWAFFNALGKNAWRNWKPRNWIFQAMQALEEWWPEWFWAFFQNQFWKLSFWSMRYMMDEDANNYGYTYDLINDEWGIPSIFRWEAEISSDKSFSYALSNNNTWNAIIQWFNDENLWEDRKTYLWDWWLAILNGSNLFNATKNAVKAIPVYGEDIADAVWLGKRIQPFTMNSFVDVISKTRAWDELIRTWRIIPKTPLEMKAFVEEFVDAWNDSANRSNLKPYGSNFAKAIMNFHQFWHANWEKPHSNDAELEIMLNDIRYVKGADWKPTKQETQFWTNMVNYIVNHPADMDTTSRLISQDVFQWLEDNNDNPNYLMYQSLVWQGMVDWYLDSAWTRFQNDWNSLYWGKKAAQKISKEDWIKSWLYWWDFMTYLLNSKLPWSEKPLVEYLQELDRKTAMDANLKIIKNQMTSDLDRKQLEHYVSFKTDSYGNEYTEINSQYASQLKAFGWMWDAIEKWDIDLLVARMSRYANEYINTKKDPTWLNTATTLLSLVNRVRESNLAPDLKIKMMSALAENNIEFLQQNVDVMREIFWNDLADAFISAWNELIYWIDWAVNSAIWEALMNWDGDAVKSWTGLSNKIKNCLSAYTSPNSKYWASWDWFGWRSWDTAERVPYVLDIAKLLDATWGKWYSPKIEDIKIYTSRKAPDLSIAKDVKRNTKAYNSQEVSKKKVVL